MAIARSNSKLDFQQCEMRHIVLDWQRTTFILHFVSTKT